MKTIRADLSPDLTRIKLYTLADLHIGDAHCDYKKIESVIDEIMNDDEAFVICNGDICNCAVKTSVSDVYSEQLTPMQELQKAVELLYPIRNKIIYIGSGNHEDRIWKSDGLDLSELIAIELGLGDRFASEGCAIFLRFGRQSKKRDNRPICYVLYCTHGSGGGKRDGSKLNVLADMQNIIDADIYIHSHVHTPMTLRKGYYRTCRNNSSVEYVDRLFVNTAATLNYGGYGQKKEYSPASKRTPIIILDGRTRNMSAIL